MFHRILVPVDSSAFASAAIAPAVAIARTSGAEVDFILVHELPLTVAEGAEVLDVAQRGEESAYIESRIDPLVAELRSQGIWSEVALRHGSAAETIMAFAEDRQSDLVVMASHGRTGFGRAMLGSVADRLMRELDCPILMVRPGQAAGSADGSFHRIVVLLDGSPEAEAVLRDAEALAHCAGATLLLLRVVRPVTAIVGEYALPELMLGSMLDDDATSEAVVEAEAYLSRVATDLRRRGPISVETDVHLATEASAVLPVLVRGYRADVVAMTTHGRGALRFILGSVADSILRGADCAVLLRRRHVAAAGTGAAVPVVSLAATVATG